MAVLGGLLLLPVALVPRAPVLRQPQHFPASPAVAMSVEVSKSSADTKMTWGSGAPVSSKP